MNTSAIKTAVALVGSQSELARQVNTRQGTLWKWLRKGVVPAEKCAAIERATGGKVTRYQLRPDVFGTAPSDASAQHATNPPTEQQAA